MPSFTHDGVALAYDDIAPPDGADRVIVLVHGFASNRIEGWRRTGWYAAFARRGARVVALDQRGHGESAKLYDPADYARGKLAADVLALMDHLDLGRADLFGYSMGARTALAAALAAPQRISNLILGGVGAALLEPAEPGQGAKMAEAMQAADPESIGEPMLRSFRQFAEEQGEDLAALAALARSVNPPLEGEALRTLAMPVLVVAGQRDAAAGDPEDLAGLFPQGRGLAVAGCDHFSAIPHALTKAAVFDFLDGLLDDPFPEGF